MTAYASVDTAIEAMKEGASDYITKPFKVDEIKLVIAKIIDRKALLRENKNLKRQLQDQSAFDKFIGVSEPALRLKKLAKRIAGEYTRARLHRQTLALRRVDAHALHCPLPEKCPSWPFRRDC